MGLGGARLMPLIQMKFLLLWKRIKLGTDKGDVLSRGEEIKRSVLVAPNGS